MFSSTQNSQLQSRSATQAPTLAPLLAVDVSEATSSPASSVTSASKLSASPTSFRKLGGTLKSNIYGKR